MTLKEIIQNSPLLLSLILGLLFGVQIGVVFTFVINIFTNRLMNWISRKLGLEEYTKEGEKL